MVFLIDWQSRNEAKKGVGGREVVNDSASVWWLGYRSIRKGRLAIDACEKRLGNLSDLGDGLRTCQE